MDFDNILNEMCEEYQLKWYDILDGKLFVEFEFRVANKYGKEILISDIYKDWLKEIIADI